MSFRGAIFDLDGTLVDSLPTIHAALNEGLVRLGHPARSRAEVAAMVGEGVGVLCSRALGPGQEDRIEPLKALVFDHYENHLLEGTTFFPGVLALLDGLAARGARLGVLSNKPDRFTRRLIDELGAGPRFAAVRGQREGMPRKPDPAGAFWVLGALGLEPKQTLYVGDTAIDVATAKAAGMPCAAVTWGFRDRAQLEAQRPDFLVDRAEELLALYDGAAPSGPPGSREDRWSASAP